MKRANIDTAQLKRSKNATPEERMEWLYAALQFARAKKINITNKRSSAKK